MWSRATLVSYDMVECDWTFRVSGEELLRVTKSVSLKPKDKNDINTEWI